MVRHAILIGLLLACTPAVFAQRAPIDPPVANRPVDFSNIVGKYSIQASAEPTEIRVEEPITLRITITGAGPQKYRPDRKHLKLFPAEWEKDFYVQEMRDDHRMAPDEKTWVFVYRLRPKHLKVDAIADIKLVTYDPDKPGRNKFETKYAERIAIVVRPKPDTTGLIEVPEAAAPDSFYRHVEARNVQPTSQPISGAWLFPLIALPPLASLLGLLAWRRIFPDQHRRQQQFRSSAADRALADVRAGRAAPWSIVHRYLGERFDFPIDDATPVEAAAFLNRRGFALTVCVQCRTFLEACDAVRFATDEAPLSDAAGQLIRVLEADPCARR